MAAPGVVSGADDPLLSMVDAISLVGLLAELGADELEQLRNCGPGTYAPAATASGGWSSKPHRLPTASDSVGEIRRHVSVSGVRVPSSATCRHVLTLGAG